MYSSRTIFVDSGQRLIVINMNDTPIHIGEIHSYVKREACDVSLLQSCESHPENMTM